MAKVITIRLSNDEYQKIVSSAHLERRALSNFMTTMVLKGIEEAEHVDAIEMDQITSDKRLMAKLLAGHRDAKKRRGRLVG